MVDGRVRESAYALGAKQRYLLRRDQLLEVGFDGYELRKWLEQGSLASLLPATYRLTAYPETWEQRVQAADWWGGAGAAACGPTAAALHGLQAYDRSGPVHLSLPTSPKLPRKQRGFDLLLHPGRVLGPWDLEQREGLVFTRIERTLLDLAPTLTPEQLEALVDECLEKGLTHAGRLRACLQRLKGKGRKGTEPFGRLLKLRANTLLRTDSPMETQFLKFLDGLGLKAPRTRYWVSRGTICYRLDLAYVDERVGIEIDSRRFHDGWAERLADMDRQNDLVAWGWRILRFTHKDLNEPERVRRLIRDTLAQSERRSAA